VLARLLVMRDSCADEEDAPCVLLKQLPEALLRRIVEVRDMAARAMTPYAAVCMQPACVNRRGSGAVL
jgi:hypothetical protein